MRTRGQPHTPRTEPGMKRRGTVCPVSDSVLCALESLRWPPLDEFPSPVKAGAVTGFPKGRANSDKKQKQEIRPMGKTDGAGSRACAGPGLEPLPGQNLIKQDMRPGHGSPGLRPPGAGQARVTNDAGLFRINSGIRRHWSCFFQTQLPPKLYSSCNEAIIHDDKILERICIIHFFS